MTLAELLAAAGALAPEIENALNEVYRSTAAALQAEKSLTAAAQAALDKSKERFDKFLATAQDALAAGDFDSLKAILFPAVEDEKKTEEERRKDEIRAKAAQLRDEAAKLLADIGEAAAASEVDTKG